MGAAGLDMQCDAHTQVNPPQCPEGLPGAVACWKCRHVGCGNCHYERFPRRLSGKESACQCRRLGFSPWGWEDHLEKEMTIHSSTLAWKIPWTEEPGT